MIRISVDENRIREFCEKWNISELGLFGSVLTDDFRAESDVDVLVKFGEEAIPTLFDLSAMQMELSEIFGRDVDLLTKEQVENSRHVTRKNSILSSVEILHGT
ncbi:MAG: hypothetical protein Tsb009_14250 [Planctomycetaceae bacterium]